MPQTCDAEFVPFQPMVDCYYEVIVNVGKFVKTSLRSTNVRHEPMSGSDLVGLHRVPLHVLAEEYGSDAGGPQFRVARPVINRHVARWQIIANPVVDRRSVGHTISQEPRTIEIAAERLRIVPTIL